MTPGLVKRLKTTMDAANVSLNTALYSAEQSQVVGDQSWEASMTSSLRAMAHLAKANEALAVYILGREAT